MGTPRDEVLRAFSVARLREVLAEQDAKTDEATERIKVAIDAGLIARAARMLAELNEKLRRNRPPRTDDDGPEVE